MSTKQNTNLFNRKIFLQAAKDSVIKLNPSLLVKNPVIFIVGIGSVLTTIIVSAGIFNLSIFR
jgi:K+-transporting ATPase ATPase B chain